MFAPLDPQLLRALTARLVACPSVSPDVAAETRCAAEVAAALPDSIERGAWPTPDGRPVVWAFAPGRTASTVVLLGHYDTVGVGEFAALDGDRGGAIAFDPDAVRERVLAMATAPGVVLDARLRADLDEERRAPGTWMFGRGGLDMKSGLAVGIATIRAIAALPERPACGVLFVATPDEEHQSAGMITALRELRRLRDDRGLRLAGVLNLDYAPEPAAYFGAMGKIEIGCYVVGRPTHVGAPFAGIDASELAAAVVARVTRSRELVDRLDGVHGVPAVTMRLRDLKQEYNVQTAREAYAEFNLITVARPLDRTLEIVRREVALALHGLRQSLQDFAAWLEPDGRAGCIDDDALGHVFTVPQLVERAGGDAGVAVGPDAPASASGGSADARAATLDRLRILCARAGVTGPAVIVHLVPPYYPSASPGDGPLVRAARAALADADGVAVRSHYPMISDACYACWRGESAEAVARHMPALGREYHLPHDDARSLDLDVVNLGAWGHDGHGLFERVHAGYAFERLPSLVAAVLDRLSRLAEGE